MQRRWRLEEVRGVAIGEEGPGAEGKGAAAAVQRGRLGHLCVRLKHGRLLALLVLAGHLSVARLDAVLLHGEGSVDLGKGSSELRVNGQVLDAMEGLHFLKTFILIIMPDSRCAA